MAKLVRKVRDDALTAAQPTALCVHRSLLPHVLDALDMSPATLVTGEFLVAHLTADGSVHAVEKHCPTGSRSPAVPTTPSCPCTGASARMSTNK